MEDPYESYTCKVLVYNKRLTHDRELIEKYLLLMHLKISTLMQRK